MVIWHNVDTITHRVVLNDLSIDTGTLNPGAFSSQSSRTYAIPSRRTCSSQTLLLDPASPTTVEETQLPDERPAKMTGDRHEEGPTRTT